MPCFLIDFLCRPALPCPALPCTAALPCTTVCAILFVIGTVAVTHTQRQHTLRYCVVGGINAGGVNVAELGYNAHICVTHACVQLIDFLCPPALPCPALHCYPALHLRRCLCHPVYGWDCHCHPHTMAALRLSRVSMLGAVQARVAVLFHSPTAQLSVAGHPTLLHTGLGVLPAGSAPHHAIGMLQPWATGLPCELEPTPLLLGRRWVLPWPECACFAYDLHTEGDVHCTCGMHQMLACFACPHVRTGWLIAHTAYAFQAMTALRAQDMNLVMTIGASEDIPE